MPLTRSAAAPYALGLAGAFVLMVPAALNGFPFLFDDSQAYLRGGQHALAFLLDGARDLSGGATPSAAAVVGAAPDGTPVQPADRSAYYAVFVGLSNAVAGLWGVAFVQGFATATLVAVALWRCLRVTSPLAVLSIVAALALTSGAGHFAGYVMPDIFAALVILAVALFGAYWHALYGVDKAFVGAVALFGVLAHPSHLAVAVALGVALAAVALIRAGGRNGGAHYRPLAALVGLVCAAFAATHVANLATTRYLGTDTLRLPHLSASLVDLGAGTRLLNETCPQSGYALCGFRDRLPVHWTKFLFDRDPQTGVYRVADPQTRVAISDEQVRFFVDVVTTYPVETALGLAENGLAQLASFSLRHLKVSKWEATRELYPADIRAGYEASAVHANPDALTAATRIVYAVVALSALFLVLSTARLVRSHDEGATDLTVLIGLALAGVLINAAVCGVLASPFDRFQARVIWLVPCVALLTLAHSSFRRRALP